MQCVWFENGTVSMTSVDVPVPQPGELLIRIRLAGVCNTDLEQIGGYYEFTGILGHEFVGEVVSGNDSLVSKRVVGEINVTCEKCDFCNAGWPAKKHCSNRTVLGIWNKNGCFAEYITLPERNCFVVPDHVSDEMAVFVEPLAAALEIHENYTFQDSDKVLVVGDGKLGLLIVKAIAAINPKCRISVLGRHQNKLDIVKDQVESTICTTNSDDLASITPKIDKQFDVSVDATGSHHGLNIALVGLRPRGTLFMKSTFKGSGSLLLQVAVVNEIRMIGSRCGPIKRALEMLALNQIDIYPLIDKRFKRNEWLQGIEAAKQRGTSKILLENV